ncbi:tetratricopeptide repeat protein [Halopseudomonas pachastrellae]|uniref:tetratricopeptide repeat protein n=1 Tax=Halopseudomonas pachastrellae TaxID=254161 RepID=UPI003D7D710D
MRVHTSLLLALALVLGGCQNLSGPDSLLTRSGEIIKTQTQKLSELATRITGDPEAEARHAEVESLFAQQYIDPLTRYINAHADDPAYADYLPLVREERVSRCQAIDDRYRREQPTRSNLQRLRAGYQFSCPQVVSDFASRLPAAPKPSSEPSTPAPVTATTGNNVDADNCYLLFAIKNYQQAEPACRAPAESGDAKAQYHLAAIAQSSGDQTTALRWARSAAAQGQPSGQMLLAELLQQQGRPTEALGWLKRAANSDLPAARYQLAQAYQQGLGTEADSAQAENQLRRAADEGYLPAMLALGRSKSGSAAGRHWLQQAAEAGSPEAQYRLGLDYMQGTGGPADLQAAYVWLSLSLVNGEQRGKQYVERLSAQLDSDQLASARAQIQNRLNSR